MTDKGNYFFQIALLTKEVVMNKRISYLLMLCFLFAGAVSYAAADKNLAKEDKKFLNDAANGGMMEVQLGQLAEQKATSPDVKNFGARMVTDHGKANDELKKIAARKGATLPGKLESKLKSNVERLTKLSGGDFDKKYMHEMVKDHTKDVAEFRDATTKVKDPDLNAFAAKTLPILEDHLKQAKDIAQKVGVDVNKAEQEGRKHAEKRK